MMSKKSKQLNAQLEGLNAMLTGAGNRVGLRPVPKKRLDGSDQFGGYPPA